MHSQKSLNDLSLRVAFPYDKPSSFYEPTNIHLAPEYFLLEYIYSPLVEIGQEGELVPSVAETFEWKGDDLYLKIRETTTVDGTRITADDVIFSLKRLIVKTGNTHGEFGKLVCGDIPITHIDDQCPGIVKKDDFVILKAGNRRTFLLPMLAAIDFAIIPRESVDPSTLAIINYKQTSGPYYVAEDSETGHLTLKANPAHFHYSDKMPQTVFLVPTDLKNSGASLDAFREGKVDFITTIDSARPEYVIDFAKENSNSTLHTTMNLRSFVLAFTSRGLKELSKADRQTIGKAVKNAFLNEFRNASGYEESSQFFPSYSDGGLKPSDIAPIVESQLKATGPVPKNLKITMVRMGGKDRFVDLFRDSLPGVQVESGNVPEFTKYQVAENMPHMSIGGPDTGFLEDIGLISYSLNAGIFGMSKPERERWLNNYMLTPNKEDRLEQLRSLHKQSLENAVIVPLMVAPYVALIRKGWSMNFPQYYGNSPLWQIKAL